MRTQRRRRPERGARVRQHALGVGDDRVGAARQPAQQTHRQAAAAHVVVQVPDEAHPRGLDQRRGDVRLEAVGVHDGRVGVDAEPRAASSGIPAATRPRRVAWRAKRSRPGAAPRASHRAALAQARPAPEETAARPRRSPASRQRSASGPGPGVTTVMRQDGSSCTQGRQQRQQAGLRSAERRRGGQAHQALGDRASLDRRRRTPRPPGRRRRPGRIGQPGGARPRRRRP